MAVKRPNTCSSPRWRPSRHPPSTGGVAAKRPNTLFKIAAVVSAVLLVGGFVSYRAGAFNRLLGKSVYMGGSKSGIIYKPDSPQQPPPGTVAPASSIMSGSKSLAPLV